MYIGDTLTITTMTLMTTMMMVMTRMTMTRTMTMTRMTMMTTMTMIIGVPAAVLHCHILYYIIITLSVFLFLFSLPMSPHDVLSLSLLCHYESTWRPLSFSSLPMSPQDVLSLSLLCHYESTWCPLSLSHRSSGCIPNWSLAHYCVSIYIGWIGRGREKDQTPY